MNHRSSFLALLIVFFALHISAKDNTQLWVLDAGHGGHDVGCEGSKCNEKTITLAVAKRVAQLVQQNIPGVRVRMTRNDDRFVSLAQRANIANQAGADLFVSIHVNSAPEASQVRGTETYYGPIGATNNVTYETARRNNIIRSELLAWSLQQQYGLAGRPISRGVKRERYYVILYTRMPSVLTEVGFISNQKDQEYMMSAAGQEEMAQCIYRGLKQYNETVAAGREKSTLALLRSTGGRTQKNKPLLPTEPQLAQNTGDSKQQAPNTSSSGSTSTKTSTSSNKTASSNTTNNNTTPTIAALGTSEAERIAKAEARVVLDPTLEPELETGELRFCIQICALNTRISVKDARLKGLKGVEIMEKDGRYKYICGNTHDYEDARHKLAEVRTLFPDAFLLAFIGSRQISTADAQEMYIQKK